MSQIITLFKPILNFLAHTCNYIAELLKSVLHFLAKIYNFIQTTPFFTENVFNFIIVIGFFIWLLFFKLDIIGLLDKKSKETANIIKKAEDKNAEAQKYLSDTKKSLANTDNDVEKIVFNAKETAKKTEENSIIELNNEIQNIKDRENLQKQSNINKVQNELSAKIANAAVWVSEEYIKNSLDEKTHKELIYNFIDELDEGDIYEKN